MERVLANTSATISATFQVDGQATDPSPDSATVTLTRADGTILQAAVAAVDGGTGKFTYLLTPAKTATYDIVTASWTATLGGQVQTLTTRVEIVGGFLFSIADLNTLLQNPTGWTLEAKSAARLWAETRIEKCIGRSFVPRYAYETLDGRTCRNLTTNFRPVRLVRTIEFRSGSTWTSQPVTSYDVGYTSIESGYFPQGYRNVRVGYEYGEDGPGEGVSQAAALWAKVRLVQGPIDDRELQRFISDTGSVVNLSTPGRNSWSGIPDVDAVIKDERIPLVG